MEIIKLVLRNKVIEIINFFYDMWHEGIVFKYMTIWIIGLIPGVSMWYIWFVTHNPSNESNGLILFVSFAFWMFSIAALCVVHLIGNALYNWIKENIQIAKEGIQIRARWRDK